MRCRNFENKVAEWAAGRLPSDVAGEMEAHCGACARCGAMADAERQMRRLWKELPEPRVPDVWARLSYRLDAPAPAPVRRVRPVRVLAYGGAFAAAGVLVAVLLGQPRVEPISAVSLTDERHVIQMVADLKTVPDADRDPFLTELRENREDEQFVLTGGGR